MLPTNLVRTFKITLFHLLLCAPALAADFIPVAEISRGMKGYGLTVFEGSQIDTFAVEVIGIQEKSRVAGSVILIQVSGHDLERSSIVQGMSGSPVFIEGRFAGALAFGWAGSLKSIAGVTPAADMFALPREADVERRKGASYAWDDSENMVPLLAGNPAEQELAAAVLGVAAPTAGAVSGATVWTGAETMIQDLLRDVSEQSGIHLPYDEGWYCLPAGQSTRSAGQAAGNLPALAPGASCAVPLVTGDALLGVTGTVTWVDGDDVLMMGHPFMQRGPVDLPLATAEILTVLPNRQMSFKMGTIGGIVGSVHHDQRAGLSGKLGPSPEMIPVTVDVSLSEKSNGTPSRQRRYEFQVVQDALLTPSLVFWTLYNSILAEGDDASHQNVNYEVSSHWQGLSAWGDSPLVVRGVASGPGGALTLAGDWMAPFSLLMGNPFQKVKLESVYAHLELSRPDDSSRIIGLDGPRNLTPDAGEILVQVEMQPRFGDPEVVAVKLPLPENLAPGPYRLVAANAAEFFALEAQRAAGTFQVKSLDGLMNILTMERSGDDLVVALLAPGQNLVLDDREMPHLPGSVSRLMRRGNMEIQPTLADFVARTSQPRSGLIQGHAVRKVRVLPAAAAVREERRP